MKFNLSILLVLLCSYAFGQISYIDTVTVNASNLPMKMSETGRHITVITQQQLLELPANSLDEVLQTISGIEIQSRNGFGAQADISMRGSTFTQVLILVDGMKLNDPLTAHFNGNIPITFAEIERIEILRGPAAALYGPDAVGGVINFISKTFSNKKVEEKSIGGELIFGDNQLVKSNQGFAFQKGKLKVGGGLSITQSIGEHVEEKVLMNGSTLEEYYNDFDIKTAGLSFAQSFGGAWTAKARLAYDHRDFSARYFYTSSPLDKSREITQNWWSHAQLSKVGKKSFTDFNIAYKYNTDRFVFSPDFPSTNEHVSDYLNLNLNHSFNLSRMINLKTGIQVDQRKIESNDRGNHQDWHYGVYAMALLKPIDLLSLTASIRADYDQNYKFEFSPQLNASYLLDNLVLRAAVGKSIRAADYTERYVSNNLESLTAGRSLGNPDLLAEKSWSEEIGFDYYMNENLTLKATAFARQSSELIDYVERNQSEIGAIGDLQEGANYFFAENISDVSTTGVELDLAQKFDLGNNNTMSTSISYTYLNTSSSEEEVSVYISSHAKHLCSARLFLQNKFFKFGLTGLYKERPFRIAPGISSTLEDSYYLLNAMTSFRISEHLEISLQMNNITDVEYQNVLGAAMPRRWFMGGLRFGL